MLGKKVLAGMQQVFQTRHPVVIYPGVGHRRVGGRAGQRLSPGDAVLMFETGHFASLWQKMAERLGLRPEFLAARRRRRTGLPVAWRRGVDPALVEERLRADAGHAIKAVCVVHNETSTGVTSDIAAVRRAIDAAGHPALLMVDTISGLGSRRLPARRMGRRRHGQRLAEGPDAAARPRLQRALAQGARRERERRRCPRPTGPGTRSSR